MFGKKKLAVGTRTIQRMEITSNKASLTECDNDLEILFNGRLMPTRVLKNEVEEVISLLEAYIREKNEQGEKQ